MAQTVKIRLDGPGGLPMTEKILKTTYASGMDFEPDERRMRITPTEPLNCRSAIPPTWCM